MMRDMKLPRFSLRTLFVLVAIAAVPMGWVAYQLNWIRQRHEFIRQTDFHPSASTALGLWQSWQSEGAPSYPPPWSLRVFGEQEQRILFFRQSQEERARDLFPEHFNR